MILFFEELNVVFQLFNLMVPINSGVSGVVVFDTIIWMTYLYINVISHFQNTPNDPFVSSKKNNSTVSILTGNVQCQNGGLK